MGFPRNDHQLHRSGAAWFLDKLPRTAWESSTTMISTWTTTTTTATATATTTTTTTTTTTATTTTTTATARTTTTATATATTTTTTTTTTTNNNNNNNNNIHWSWILMSIWCLTFFFVPFKLFSKKTLQEAAELLEVLAGGFYAWRVEVFVGQGNEPVVDSLLLKGFKKCV